VKYMAYTRGSSNDIIVGAAALFTYEAGALADADRPAFVAGTSYKDTLTADSDFRNVGYTMNGLEIQFQPDFGEVAVDQVLDVAKLFKQGMQVNLNTTFAESTLENLLFALAGKDSSMTTVSGNPTLNLSAGDIGDVPVERGLVAVGPGTGDASEILSASTLHTVHFQSKAYQYQQRETKRQCSKYHSVFFQMIMHHTVRS